MIFDSKKTLYIIDGSSFLYRAYYGVKPLFLQNGKAVHAIFGFCKMMKKIIDDCSPLNIAVVWDSKGKTERHEIYKDYKSTRQKAPNDLYEQKDQIIEFLKLIKMKQFAIQSIEADDILSTLAKKWSDFDDQKSVIITLDKDMGQTINSNIVLYDSLKQEIIDSDVFLKKMGFMPEKLPFYFSLVGDSSDNIPGVTGIGAKGALDLVLQFKSLEDLYLNLDDLKGEKIKQKLIDGKLDAFLSYELFLLRDCYIDFNKDDCLFDKNNFNLAQDFFKKYDFKSFSKKDSNEKEDESIDDNKTPSCNDFGYNFELINDEIKLKQLIKEIHEERIFAFDTETDGLKTLNSNLIGISISSKIGKSYYIPIGHKTEEFQLNKKLIIDYLKPLFFDHNIKKIAHNAKFDQLVLFDNEIEINEIVFDTMIAANLIKDEWQKVSLKALSEQYLNQKMDSFEVVVRSKNQTFADVNLSDATKYAAADAHQTLQLYYLLKNKIDEFDLNYLFEKIEMPTINVLFKMEFNGIFCDVIELKKLDVYVVDQLNFIYNQVISLVDVKYNEINLNSSHQVADLLFNFLQLPVLKKNTKSQSFSTDADVLKILAKKHIIPGLIMHYRELSKLKNTYIDSLPEYINPKTNKIHTNFSQIRVATGRLSSSDPNLQNIPIGSIGKRIRKSFKPDFGYSFVAADYSQIELRVLAHLSKDEVLVRSFNENIDIHSQTASSIFNVDILKITEIQRNIGKKINFSIIYGITPYGLSKDLDVSLSDAKKYIDAYFDKYKGVKVWMDNLIIEATKVGHVKTMFNRKRDVPQLLEKNKNLYEIGKRIAINTVVQGTAAEIMKLAMIKVDAFLLKESFDAKILLQIHDEILLSILTSQKNDFEEKLKFILENVLDFDVKLIANLKNGNSWQDV